MCLNTPQHFAKFLQFLRSLDRHTGFNNSATSEESNFMRWVDHVWTLGAHQIYPFPLLGRGEKMQPKAPRAQLPLHSLHQGLQGNRCSSSWSSSFTGLILI